MLSSINRNTVTLSALVFFVLLNSCGYRTYPKKFEYNITRDISGIAAQLLATYKYDTNLTVTNKANYKLQKIDNAILEDQLKKLNVDQISITYKVDTFSRSKAHSQLTNNIFLEVDFLDSCIQFSRRESGFTLSGWETTYGVIYYFGKNKPRIHGASDEFHNMIKQVNDSTIIFRQNLPQSR